jgi:putative ATPase
MEQPLAIKLAPKKLDEVLGQEHLIGKGKILTNLVKNKKLFSMILYGKPGIGKTSIANAIVNELGVRYRFLNATIHSKKDFDIVVEEAKMYDGLVLIMDEIHRLNKDKQDLLLPQIESGLITLIGMTTSNPYHKINPAIRSRCHMFELLPLSEEDIIEGLKRACKHEDLKGIKISSDALKYIAALSNNDLRYAYNLLEVAFYSSNDKNIGIDDIKKINNKPAFFHDKNEDGHYDVISAFQKSIRGSDVNASLYYLARLIEAEDLDIIYRRMTVIAYEDIGLANPSMGPRVDACINACERLGLPEARIPLSVMVIDLALSPKSNSAHIALDMALEDIEKGNTGNVPNHIKTSAIGYKYPHDYPHSYVKQQYLPDNIKNKKYYNPKETSKYEINLKNIYTKINEINKTKE